MCLIDIGFYILVYVYLFHSGKVHVVSVSLSFSSLSCVSPAQVLAHVSDHAPCRYRHYSFYSLLPTTATTANGCFPTPTSWNLQSQSLLLRVVLLSTCGAIVTHSTHTHTHERKERETERKDSKERKRAGKEERKKERDWYYCLRVSVDRCMSRFGLVFFRLPV